MEWTYPLKSQQTEFIERLESGIENLRLCTSPGIHGEIKKLSNDNLQPLREYCWEMVDKYRKQNSRTVFTNHMKGKLGEEVTKECLGDLISEVNYEIIPYGDGKIDFTVASNEKIGVQVKTRYATLDKTYWSISEEEIRQNQAIVCVLIFKTNQYSEDFDEFQSEYYPIMAGFLPTNLIHRSSYGNNSVNLELKHLLYGGGLKSYLNYLKSSYLKKSLDHLGIKNNDELDLSKLRKQKWKYVKTLKSSRYKENLWEMEDNYTENVAISPCGEIIVAIENEYSSRNQLHIWNLVTGEEIASEIFLNYSKGKFKASKSLGFSPDGTKIISYSEFSQSKNLSYSIVSSVNVWNSRTGREIGCLPKLSGPIAIHPTSYILACTDNNVVQLFDLDRNIKIDDLYQHLNTVLSVAFSPDGNFIASSSEDETVKIWDVKNKKLLHTFDGHSHKVSTLAVHPNNKMIASGGYDNKIIFWDLTTGKEIKKLTEHSDAITSITFNPDGLVFASSSNDQTIKLWCVQTGKLLQNFSFTKFTNGGRGSPIAFSPDGEILAVGQFGLGGSETLYMEIEPGRYIDSEFFIPNVVDIWQRY